MWLGPSYPLFRLNQNVCLASELVRFVVVDGTFVTATGLQLTKPSKVAHVHTMMGFMRDDGAAFFTAPV